MVRVQQSHGEAMGRFVGAEVASYRRFEGGRHHQEAEDGSRDEGGVSAGGGAVREDSAQEDAEGSGGSSGTWVVWGVV